MSLIDLLRSPWAVMPDRLDEYQAIYASHLRGEKIDIEAIEARLGHPLANDQQDYTVEDGGVAVLSLQGAISPKANLFTRISGGASASVFAQQVESMRADSRVRSAVIDVDSPGGNVLGIPAAARALAQLAAEKPTVTVSTGLMASGGYWIGSAANAIYISGETDMIGSIGVVATHSYDPRATGVQRTEITAGKYKRIASDTGPLTKEGRAYLQAQVDEIYRVFVDTVATNRRVTPEQVLSHMADGRVFVGQQAIDAGLVDGIATVDAMVAQMASNPEKFSKRRKAVFALGGVPAVGAEAGAKPVDVTAGDAAASEANDEPVPPVASETTPKGVPMSAKDLAAKFAAENPEAAALIRAEGAQAEMARVKSVREQAMPGHEALIEKLAADGSSTGADAAMAIVSAERKVRADAVNARTEDAKPPVNAPAAETDTAKQTTAAKKGDLLNDPEALDKAATAYQAAHPGTDYLAAVQAVQKGA